MARSKFAVLMVFAAMFLAPVAWGQAQDNGGGNRGNRQRFDPAEFRQRMMDRLKEQLGASDDEWKVLQPKIEKLQAAQRDSRGGGGFMFGGRGGRGPGGDQQPESAVARASQALRQALENKDTPAADIQQKLAAYREARDKAREALTAAQKDIKELLTQRQEAILVTQGMLE